ncbi:MAG: glycoside hydrolase family 3 C-terminal domain-containing protein [Oscillospiraceae bacterium]|jgi:beta-glucosidase|nr:glycoside hydrolase family 3 C-terminal domain-containing protein [Oscillospiraceae bacterium]
MSEQSKAVLKRLTTEEKLQLIAGADYWHTFPVERLGVPSVMMSDGPHGLRKQTDQTNALGLGKSVQAVCFPTAAGTAASFDRAVLRRLGETLGEECRAAHLSMLLGPAVNIKRSPLCGRNFEYFSEDPYLAAELAVSYTQGLQSKGVSVSIKHFAANNQEKRRMTVHSVVDERALRELYFPAFEQTVRRAAPGTVMCAYNRLFEGGTYCSENKRLLSDILRGEWGFKGAVVSDWGAVSNRPASVAAGLDLEMPNSGDLHTKALTDALESGALRPEALDAACENVLDFVFRFAEAADESKYAEPVELCAEHQKARTFARESMVLLKNNGVLPLKAKQKTAFLGGFAKQPRYQGAGSSRVNPYHVVSALEAAMQRGNLSVEYAEGFGAADYACNPVLLQRAVALAGRCEVAVIFAGLPDAMESEGSDRQHLELPPCQNELIRAVARVQPNTVVVLHNGAPVRMPWINDVAAVLESYLAGETVGEAQLDLLYGDFSPCGKLAETFPLALQDTPCYDYFPGNPKTVEYRESIFVGYRYYDKAAKEVLFPFGHGLTYTTFQYSDLKLSAKTFRPGDLLNVSLTVENTGDYDAAEIVQLYVEAPESGTFRAQRELKGFAKVFLKAGEKRRVSMELDASAFAYYHTGLRGWHCESGSYALHAAASSRDIRLSACVELENPAQAPSIYDAARFPSYQNADLTRVTDAEFEALLGFPLPPAYFEPGHRLTLDSSLEESAQRLPGRLAMKAINLSLPLLGIVLKDLGDPKSLLAGVTEMPIRTMAEWAHGMINREMAEAMVSLFNEEHCLRSLYTLAKGGLRTVKRLLTA